MNSTVPVMQATPKAVLVVENNPSVQLPLVKNLNQRGFKAKGAANRMEMRRAVLQLRQDVDVAVLDGNLEGDDPAVTGFDIGQEIIETQFNLPPQRIAYSGHTEPKYYEAAALLGVDDYIQKAMVNADTILFNRVRTSSLVRSLSPERSEISEKLEQIAEGDFDRITAASRVCLQVIAPEVDVCLDMPSIFLLSGSKGTQILSPETGYLSMDRFAVGTQIQDRVFMAESGSEPFVFSRADWDIPLAERNGASVMQLEGASFVALYNEDGLRLSLGILPAKIEDPLRGEKNPLQLASNLNFKLLEPTIKQFRYLSQVKTTIEKTKLKYTSNFCLYVGRTQISALEESLDKEEIEASNGCFRTMKKLAEDLCATGLEFSHLTESAGRGGTDSATAAEVSVREVVDDAWGLIKKPGDSMQLTQTGPDLALRIARRDLLTAVLRVLQWLTQRGDKLPPGSSSPAIEVAYERQPGRVAIRFTDQSRRLGEHIRKRLFEPFTQGATISTNVEDKGEPRPGLYLPLYLAKTLLTVKNDGLFEDRSAELPNKVGHCFVFSFPVEEEEEGNPAAPAG